MTVSAFKLYLGIILAVGSVWGLTRRLLPVLLVGMAILFKLFDAALLPVAWNHGSIFNPAYASTNIPLAIYTAPVAILISMIMVPLGYPGRSLVFGPSPGSIQFTSPSFIQVKVSSCCDLLYSDYYADPNYLS